VSGEVGREPRIRSDVVISSARGEAILGGPMELLESPSFLATGTKFNPLRTGKLTMGPSLHVEAAIWGHKPSHGERSALIAVLFRTCTNRQTLDGGCR
jgi:hypothetical protein